MPVSLRLGTTSLYLMHTEPTGQEEVVLVTCLRLFLLSIKRMQIAGREK